MPRKRDAKMTRESLLLRAASFREKQGDGPGAEAIAHLVNSSRDIENGWQRAHILSKNSVNL
jgi:hypothetical protein